MATSVDIIAGLIKNGSVIVSCLPTGRYFKLDDDVLYTPTIEEIEFKYDNRFDDPSYYYGGGASDGGTYTGS